MKPTVSVVIPTYNRADLLPRAIESVRAQTFGDWELIVVDDGSTDETSEIVSAFDDPRIRYIRNPRNLGLPGSRNVGLQAARADWVGCLDDDDRWMPGKLEAQLRVRDGSRVERLAAVYGGVNYEYPDGTVRYHPARHRGNLLDPLLEVGYVVTGGFSCLLISRAAALSVGGFDASLKMREDYELQLRLSLAGYGFDFVDGPVLRYRADGSDSLSRRARRRAIGILQVYRRHRSVFDRRRRGRKFVDLMHASRFLVQAGHPRHAWSVYRYALVNALPPRGGWRFAREYVAIPMKILMGRTKRRRDAR